MDVFAGRHMPLTRAARRRGWKAIPIDLLLNGAADDVLSGAVVRRLEALLRSGKVDMLFLGPPCGTFSPWMRMCRWSSRTSQQPMGGAKGRPLHWKERIGNRLLQVAMRLAAIADELGIPWVLENPKPSLLWRTSAWHRGFHKRGLGRYTASVDWCRYGRKWRKSTLFVGRAPFLPELSAACVGGHEHVILQGTARDDDGKVRSRTEIAGEYSASFCDLFIDKASAWLRGGVPAPEGPAPSARR